MRRLRIQIALLFIFQVLFSLSSSDRQSSEQNLYVAAVGDSITWGFAIEDRRENSWPARLEYLSSGKIESGNFGRSGATLTHGGDKPYVDDIAFERALDSSPDVVIIILGTNDVKGNNKSLLNEFMEDYLLLVQMFRELDSHPRIYICYPPPAFANSWRIDGIWLKEIVIPLIDQVAESSGAAVIDLHSPLIRRPDLFPDGVHPNKEGAEIIAETIYSALKESFISFL